MRKEDILRSYSKFHNRKLALLEQEDDSTTQERLPGAIESLNSADWRLTANQVTKDGTPVKNYEATIDGSPYLYRTNTGVISTNNFRFNAIVDPPGAEPAEEGSSDWISGLRQNKSEKSFKQFIGSLAGDAEIVKSDTQKKKELRVTPGTALNLTEDTALTEQEKQAVIKNLESLAQGIPAAFKNLSPAQSSAYRDEEDYRSKFVGDMRDSFENKLMNDKLVLLLRDGAWVSSEKRPEGTQSIGVSKSMSDLVRLAANESPSEDECSDLLKDFAFQAGTDRLIVSPRGDGRDRSSALSFSDPQNTYRNLLRMAANKCNPGENSDKAIRVVDVAATTQGGGNDNAIRGFMFEEILEVLSLTQLRQQGVEGRGTEDLTTVLLQKTRGIIDRLSKLKEESEGWVETSKYTALAPEEAELVKQISDVAAGLGESLNNFEPTSLFGSMLRHSKISLSGRKPTFILPVGTETKRGKRQDVLEVYKTREEAEEAAKRVGVDIKPEEFSSLDDALRGTAGVVRKEGGSVKMSEILENVGAFEEGQKVYTLKVSLKNYKKFEGHGASMGGGRKSTLPDIVQVEGNEFNNEFMKTIQSVAAIENPRQFKKYFDSVAKIASAVIDLGTKRYAQVRGKGRGNVKVDNLQSLEKSLTTTLRNQGLDLMPHAKEISKLLKNMMKQKSYSTLDSEAIYRKAQMTVIRYLEDTKLYNDINKGASVNNPNPRQVKKRRQALQYLATRMMHAGGADDDETLCDYRGLNTSKDYIFKQNDPIREAWSSILKDDDKWMLDTGEEEGNFNGGFKLTKRGTKASINFEYAINPRREKGQVVDFFGQFETRINKEALEYFNKLSESEQKKVESTVSEAFSHIMMALSLLQEKVSVID